jgi:hypothetical protein
MSDVPPPPPPPPLVGPPTLVGPPPPPPALVGPTTRSKTRAASATSIQEELLQKKRGQKEECPAFPGDAEKANQYRKFVIDRDKNAQFLVANGFNPVDVALMTVNERATYADQWRSGLLTKPVCSKSPEERAAMYPKTFGYELADECYPAEPETAKYKTLKDCKDEQLVNQVYDSLSKFIDLAFGEGMTSDKIEVLKWLQSVPQDQLQTVWSDLKATGILTLMTRKTIYDMQVKPEAAAAIKQLQEALKNPSLTKAQKANINNKIATARQEGQYLKESSVQIPDTDGRKRLAIKFFKSKIGQTVGDSTSSDDVSSNLMREIAKLRAENDSLRASLLSKEQVRLPEQVVEKQMEAALTRHIEKERYEQPTQAILARLQALEDAQKNGQPLDRDAIEQLKHQLQLVKESHEADMARLQKMIEEKGSASQLLLDTVLKKSKLYTDEEMEEAEAFARRVASGR